MFKKRIRQLRKEHKLTQQQLADKIGVGRATIAGYETKGKEPGYDTLKKLAEIFNVSTDYLLGHTDNRQNPNDKIKSAISDDPELLEFWNELSQREDLQLLFKQTRDLPKEAIQDVINIIRRIERDAHKRHN
ncbi:transcriptional regulator with XRE-family HTH domain [Orenia metallireducens]|uniref:Transcriptional regulator, contains XRE-family HTH domain n=1 Tax=Orenia metallireducens TaxID=1413210 RepID=A0A285IGH6_9FIRM|nr:helix-turn-helix domain-containing protein [Orenia metallireducens]PRX18098.1 transcriptional regulator with XRE-family HTH domain [Orenia metallireducens]SNY47023.1 Transcriptional regulator, contains XRE-family HTH domain [Orenia metallireducens]